MRFYTILILFFKIISKYDLLSNSFHPSPPINTYKIVKQATIDTTIIFKGILVDSFRSYCDRYAECICAEKILFKDYDDSTARHTKNKIVAIFIRCFNDTYDFKLYKDSAYFITATTKFKQRVIIHDDNENDSLPSFWCINIKPVR